MANRRTQGAVIGVLWLIALVVLVAALLFFENTPYAYRSGGFPNLPLYGALTWWFFFVIPLIGATWGFFNDWRGDRELHE